MKTMPQFGIVAAGLLLIAGAAMVGVALSQAPAAPSANVLLPSSLDDVAAITSPAVGLGGTTSLTGADFVAGQVGNGALITGTGKYISFPAASGLVQNVELDHGEVEFWYRPNYAAASNDINHALMVVGDPYNAPRFELVAGDRLRIALVNGDWSVCSAQSGYHAPLWAAGEWVHRRATWDTTPSPDVLQLYVNDIRVDAETPHPLPPPPLP